MLNRSVMLRFAKSVLEVYANVSTMIIRAERNDAMVIHTTTGCLHCQGRQCLTSRMYPSDPSESVGVGLLSQQGSTVVAKLEAYQLKATPATY